MTVSSEMPYVKMRLFNYGRAINSVDNAVLPFFNGARAKTSYVDTGGNDEIYDMADVSPTVSNTLVNGYPFVENNNIKASDALNGGMLMIS